MSAKTEVNLILVVSDKRQSGVSTRLSEEAVGLFSKKEIPCLLAFSPTKDCKLANTVNRISTDWHSCVVNWELLDISANLQQNVHTVTSAVKQAGVKLQSYLDRQISVLIDSDGVFDCPKALHDLVNALEDVETLDGKLNLIVGVHMSSPVIQEFSKNYPADKPLLLTLPRDHDCACRLWSNLVNDVFKENRQGMMTPDVSAVIKMNMINL